MSVVHCSPAASHGQDALTGLPPGTAAPGERHRLGWWEVRGLLPPGLAPCAISAAYTRATGRPPARDPERRVSRAYSAVELLAALAELERTRRRRPAPPPPTPFRSAPPRGAWL
jgi:hypothetical protein